MANDKQSGKRVDSEQARLHKEEQARRGRRRTRQIIGFALTILIIAGAVSIISGVVNMVEDMLDNTAEYDEYNNRITPFVWFDLLPFESLEAANPNSLKQVAIWGVMNQIGTDIERNENGEPLVSAVEVDRWGAAMFGPDFTFEHGSFEDAVENLSYQYDDTDQMYTVPATGLTPDYLASVVNIKQESGGIKRVTVGYVSTRGSNNEIVAAPDLEHPVKYMDYLFKRDGSQYYLYALYNNTELVPDAPSQTESVEAPAELILEPELDDSSLATSSDVSSKADENDEDEDEQEDGEEEPEREDQTEEDEAA